MMKTNRILAATAALTLFGILATCDVKAQGPGHGSPHSVPGVGSGHHRNYVPWPYPPSYPYRYPYPYLYPRPRPYPYPYPYPIPYPRPYPPYGFPGYPGGGHGGYLFKR